MRWFLTSIVAVVVAQTGHSESATRTWMDSYPYAAISAFALHPIYLNLSQVASGANKSLLENLEPERKRLNNLDAVDYEAVLKAKLDFLGLIYPSQKEKTFKNKDYRNFFEQNKHWLIPYATFCSLRDKHGTANFTRWSEHELGEPASGSGLVEPDFHFFIQYHLHRQLKDAADYAHSKGVILKGDLAIGVYRYGVDAWQNHDLFHLEVQAGAPPDAFAVKGQNWGFPTYNWQRMKETGFAWWKHRFAQMSYYFDAFRIDHILGFFRIWSIPLHAVEGILGYFVPALPVELDEFRSRNVAFDRNRYVKPRITNQLLSDTFGHDQEMINLPGVVRLHLENGSLN